MQLSETTFRRFRGRGRVAAVVAVACAALSSVRCADPDAGASTDNAARPGGPSVLLLVMDTVRADRCSINGYARPTTPRLAAFAQDAVVYRNAYVPGGWTGPTHVSLFTGLRPEHHGFYFGNRLYLTDEAHTLAEALTAGGWSTAAFSGNAVITPEFGMGQGFSRFVSKELFEPPYPRTDDGHAMAFAFMESVRRRGRPFFVFINDFQPHVPYAPPEPFASRFVDPDAPTAMVSRERGLDAARSIRYLFDSTAIPPANLKVRSDLYDAEIASVDDSIGNLLDRMQAAGLLEDTIVIVTSDHGEHFGERGYVEHVGSLFRPILHVPLVVRVPGQLDGGTVVESPVRLEDVFPTILEACGVPVPSPIDGESLLSLDPDRPRVARALYGRQTLRSLRLGLPDLPLERFERVLRSVIDGRWHLVRATDDDELLFEHLFDIQNDPLEATDIAAQHSDVVARLRAMLPEMPR